MFHVLVKIKGESPKWHDHFFCIISLKKNEKPWIPERSKEQLKMMLKNNSKKIKIDIEREEKLGAYTK